MFFIVCLLSVLFFAAVAIRVKEALIYSHICIRQQGGFMKTEVGDSFV